MPAKEHLIVSSKGQVTLPVAMREALGLHGSAVVTAEESGGRIVLTPAIVIETEVWSDAQIAEWAADDEFAPGERERLQKALVRERDQTTRGKPGSRARRRG